MFDILPNAEITIENLNVDDERLENSGHFIHARANSNVIMNNVSFSKIGGTVATIISGGIVESDNKSVIYNCEDSEVTIIDAQVKSNSSTGSCIINCGSLTVSGNSKVTHNGYYAIRVHEGETAVLNDLDEDDNTVTIETDKFSTYALVFREKGNDNPPHLRASRLTAEIWASSCPVKPSRLTATLPYPRPTKMSAPTVLLCPERVKMKSPTAPPRL